jgi:hypothetical protein
LIQATLIQPLRLPVQDRYDETVRLQFSPVARYPAIELQILGVSFDE